MNNQFVKNCKKLIHTCLNLKKNESLLIITDKDKLSIAKKIYKIAIKTQKNVQLLISKKLISHGQEPSRIIANSMRKHHGIICLTKMSIAHSKARYAATKKGNKFLSLPYYNNYVLNSEAFNVNFNKIRQKGLKIKKKLDKSKTLIIKTKNGTNFKININNRLANLASGICSRDELLSSPPDAEVNIAPIENSANGILVVDGSITCDEFGLLKSNIMIEFKKGIITKIQGKKAAILEVLLNKYINSKRIAEFGIGLNHKAKLCGNMLIDEGSLGNIHIGIGSNSTIGGKNISNFHLDLVIKKPTVLIDKKYLMRKGILNI